MTVAEQIEIVSQRDVKGVAFASESQVVGGYQDGNIRRWKIEDGQQLGRDMRANHQITSIAVSQDGRWIVSGDARYQTARADEHYETVWNATTHEKVCSSETQYAAINAIDISSDCTTYVAGYHRATRDSVRICAIATGTQLIALSHRYVVGVKFSPDSSRLATLSSDSGFRVYSTHDGHVLFDSGDQGSANSKCGVTPFAWSSDGQQLFVTRKGKVTCLDVSESSSSEWSIHDIGSYASIASNSRFIARSAGTSVSLWDCVCHKQIGSLISHTAEITSIALSPSGRYLACGGGKSIVIHDLRGVLSSEYFVRGPLVSQLPLVQVSDQIFNSWTHGNPTDTEVLLSEEIENTSNPSHHLLACRAILRARLKAPALATEDGKESLRVEPSPIGYIAMAVALLGQGDREGALRIFDFACHDCKLDDNRLLLLLKSILVFESGNREDAIIRAELLAARADNDNDNDAAYLYTQVLAVMYMKKGNYGRAIALIERAKSLAQKDKQCHPLLTISLIFGWNFDGLDSFAQQQLCEMLYAEGRTAEAVEILLNIMKTSDEDTRGSKTKADWVAGFIPKCAVTLERVGDEASNSAKHDDAITQYSAALSLSPPAPAGLLIKRSKARAARGLWEDALQDANEAVEADSSIPWGYEAKHAALHGAKRYDEATDAFKSMLHAIEQSRDLEIRQLRKNYIAPSQTIAAIDSIAREILKSHPLVVIDVTTGCLCDGPERMHIFEADPSFKELVSSMTSKVDDEQIQEVVKRYFRYVMFSHAWQGSEPLFQEVNVYRSVWKLPDTPLNEKLRNFCKEVRRRGHNWAWSDTCCIDKATSSVLNQSLTSMYKWYADSAATLVFLAGVAHPSKPGDLTRSLWMTRAWTLQELLAPKVVFFYDSEWKLYLNDTGDNHKESPEIMQGLATAIKIPLGTITTFTPDDLAIREKLRLASTRHARYVEDVAYSLIGIFKSDIRPHYGEGTDALGHLLEEIVARFGDVTVLAWSGKSSSYNSCLPASISVYNQTPHNPPSLEGEEMETCIAELRGELSEQEALGVYNQIDSLPPARFAARRLHLPSITFPVNRLIVQARRSGSEKVYRAWVGPKTVEFTTADPLPLRKPQRLVFAHPWISYIRGPSDEEDAWESDSESVVDFDSNSEHDIGLDEVALPSPSDDSSEPHGDDYARALQVIGGATDSDSNSEHDTGSDEAVPPLPSDNRSEPHVDDYTRALQMIARLGQPFNALLLVLQPNRHYTRVATESEIVVPGLGTDITCQDIQATVLEIL